MRSSKETRIHSDEGFSFDRVSGVLFGKSFFRPGLKDGFYKEATPDVPGAGFNQRYPKRKSLLLAVLLIMMAMLLILVDLAMYPCTFIRNDIHAVLSEKKNLVVLGSSNGKMDLDPDVLLEGTGKTGHNLCVGGEYPLDAYYLTKLMIEKNPPEQILFELDPGYFMTEKEPGNNYLLFYHEFPLSVAKILYFADALRYCDLRTTFFPAYEYSLSYELPRAGETLGRKLNRDYSIEPFKGKVQEYHENGWIEKYPVHEENFPMYDGFEFEINEQVKTNTTYLEKLAGLCNSKKILFQIAVMPVPQKALEQDAAAYETAWRYFDEFCQVHKVPLYNFNAEYYDAFSHGAEHYVDYDGHMNGESAAAFSRVFGEMLKK